MKKTGITTKDIALMGVMTATIEAAKLALSFVPNVELVTLLIILYSIHFGKKALPAIFAFVGIECLIWGLGLWVIMYLYIWPLLFTVVQIFRKQKSVWFWSILAGIYGLLFGALCSIPYFFIGGIRTAVTWWISGIPYDILHGISNFIVCFILFYPLTKVLNKVEKIVFD